MDSTTQLSPDVTINGGKTIAVNFKDGTSKEVKVRLLPLSQAEAYLDRISELTKFVELVTDQPEGWADWLTDDSVFAVDELARELNDPRFDRLLKRLLKTVERVGPQARKLREASAGSTNSSQTA